MNCLSTWSRLCHQPFRNLSGITQSIGNFTSPRFWRLRLLLSRDIFTAHAYWLAFYESGSRAIASKFTHLSVMNKKSVTNLEISEMFHNPKSSLRLFHDWLLCDAMPNFHWWPRFAGNHFKSFLDDYTQRTDVTSTSDWFWMEIEQNIAHKIFHDHRPHIHSCGGKIQSPLCSPPLIHFLPHRLASSVSVFYKYAEEIH